MKIRILLDVTNGAAGREFEATLDLDAMSRSETVLALDALFSNARQRAALLRDELTRLPQKAGA